MTTIAKTIHIAAPIEQVWAALTDPPTIGAWMGDSTIEVDLNVGGSYALFGGETTGQFTRVEYPHILDYTWRQASWQASWRDSLVRWELTPTDQGTHVQFVHSQFPNDDERASHDEGWDTYWLEPMQAWLETQ